MEIFLVGGAVRDTLLDYPSIENDWVVVGANPKQLLDLGFVNVGKDFPVFLHPETKEEYALARKERKVAGGYSGFEFDTAPHVSLEEDLSRRDLTINAIAQKPDGSLVDPFGGAKDIKARKLRHVSSAFSEDPVRVLRLARFAARYHHLGFTVADETISLAKEMVKTGELNFLVAERVWKEFEKALGEQHPEVFISVLKDCDALNVILPELEKLFGVPQPITHHPENDTGIHSLLTLHEASELSLSREVRFAALLHDLGKGLTPKDKWPKHHGHEELGISALKALCRRLKVPNDYRELAILVMRFHTHCHRAFELKPKTVLKLLKDCDAYRRKERFKNFLLSCKADARGRTGFELSNYPQANYLLTALKITEEIKAKPFADKGLQGEEIGQAIHKKRLEVLSELTSSARKSKAEPEPKE